MGEALHGNELGVHVSRHYVDIPDDSCMLYAYISIASLNITDII